MKPIKWVSYILQVYDNAYSHWSMNKTLFSIQCWSRIKSLKRGILKNLEGARAVDCNSWFKLEKKFKKRFLESKSSVIYFHIKINKGLRLGKLGSVQHNMLKDQLFSRHVVSHMPQIKIIYIFFYYRQNKLDKVLSKERKAGLFTGKYNFISL